MEPSSFYDEETVRHQFDRLSKLALKGEAANYFKQLAYRKRHEVALSELLVESLESLCVLEGYEPERHSFRVLGYDIEVNDDLLAESLQVLTEKKRSVVLLSYFLDMSDAEIARTMRLARSTIHEHWKRSLELLKKTMEEKLNGTGL
ncbi:MAG: sigma-70 family RNA polymerase sigma factor [Firmicutes bacterium]|nr:sigma-70 family RNA polymerase sigma factor [Bacillota bacterium]NBI64778.1 sigma-70 family RNA polymerase sigma factor [Clostridiales bacterium]